MRITLERNRRVGCFYNARRGTKKWRGIDLCRSTVDRELGTGGPCMSIVVEARKTKPKSMRGWKQFQAKGRSGICTFRWGVLDGEHPLLLQTCRMLKREFGDRPFYVKVIRKERRV